MVVYVVQTHYDHEGSVVNAIFANKEKALEFVITNNPNMTQIKNLLDYRRGDITFAVESPGGWEFVDIEEWHVLGSKNV